jgi:hypothetical protein
MARPNAHPITPGPCPRNRLTIDQAFQRFLRLFGEAETARQHLEAAAGHTIRLWYGNTIIDHEFFQHHLMIHCEIAADKRPLAELWVTRSLTLDGVSDWTMSRADVDSYIKQRQDAKRSPAGARRQYDRGDVLIEGAGVFLEDGSTSFEQFWPKVKDRLGPKSPGDTLLKQILRPLHQRLKNAVEP